MIHCSKESPSPEAEQDQVSEVHGASIMSFVTEEHFVVEEYTQSDVVVEQREKEEKKGDDDEDKQFGSEGWAIFRADDVEIQLNLKQRVEKERKENAEKNDDDDNAPDEQFFIGTSQGPGTTANYSSK